MKSSTEFTFAGRTVLVVGLAREGMVAARWLVGQGARVIASDLQATAGAGEMDGLGVELRIGPQTPDLLAGVDVVVASPGVPQDLPLFLAAQAAGLPITTETRLFAQLCPAKIVGVTGSSGKTTTTTLTAKMLEASGYRTWLGGNIGEPLLGRVAEVGAGDRVALELSSFQLLYWGGRTGGRATEVATTGKTMGRATEVATTRGGGGEGGISPQVAGVLNLTPNHLDRHPSLAHYAAAKANILASQSASDVAVLNGDDPLTAAWAATRRVRIEAGSGQEAVDFPLAGRVLSFSLRAQPEDDGAWLSEDGWVWLRWQGQAQAIVHRRAIKLRGEHNLANVLAACCLAAAADASPTALCETASAFAGVEHRLQIVRHRRGVWWIDDSIATSPERAMAALRSFDEPIILLAGGRDKHLPWAAWAATVHERARHVIVFGEAAGLIKSALLPLPADSRVQAVHTAADLATVVSLADALARPGDVVLLSPGGTSFDAYRDFTARGRHFRDLVLALPEP
ncbi:MAG: UDP-N-acetylmuramoyl-L-alanine--D-glutamate ligase [Caldilineales bacterium]|nr:UDP-N-acetylmuramoyl-L-alanine--D-glutamate ligase [Caldilineales bacterium]MCW5857285.1 UDP-N-acetylmuramoyl-L-alanine--D-glutamate ligase [Caldilineales bacterium]